MTASSEIGPNLPGLEFQRRLGSGGFSDVYLYDRQRPRMQVAVKVLRADIMDAAQQAQFVAEADTMGELAEHPYIVPVLGAGTAPDGRPFLEMRYYPGPDLAERVKAQPLSVPDALKMGIQLASAIETAHRAGIIHRDIKPQNVLISSYGVPGLTDFGIAGRPGEVEEDENVGVSMPWSPPEVLTGSSNGSHASDVYSLGATIWNVLVGRSPFSLPGDDNSQRALFTRIVHSKPPMTGRADVPGSLERLLAQAMAKKPEHRPRSAMEFARQLQRVEQELRLARTDIVVLEHGHEAVGSSVPEPHSQTPTATKPETMPGGPGGDLTTLRPPAMPTGPVQDAAPTSRRPARVDPGAAPTARRPAKVDPGAAPTARRPAKVDPGAAPTARRPAKVEPGAAPTARRPAKVEPGAAAVATAAPTAAPAAAAESESGHPSSKGRWIAIGGVAALLVAAVGIGALLSQGDDTEKPDPGAVTQAPEPTSGTDLGVEVAPGTPDVQIDKITDTKVTFSWTREEEGDSYSYEVLSLNGALARQAQRTDKTTVVVAALPDGHTCLRVTARRGTQGSNPGQRCT